METVWMGGRWEMKTVNIMFNNSSAIQGLEVEEYREFDGWVYLKCTDGEVMRLNKENIVYISWREENEID